MTTAISQPRHTRRRRNPHLTLIGLRVNAGLSREDFGRRIGVSRETIRLAEDGFVPSVRVQFAIAGEFNMRPLDLWPIERQRGVRS